MKMQRLSRIGWNGRQIKTAIVGIAGVMILSILLLTNPEAPTPSLFLSPSSFSGESLWWGGGTRAPQCSPVDHVFFLKTHKCASSTVQNIFLRYGYRNNLTFALPLSGNYLGNPQPFNTKMVWKQLVPPGGKVDIFAVHTRMNPTQHSAILHNDTLWITIVRDPAALYESLFNFFSMGHMYGLKLEDYVHKRMQTLISLPRYGGKLGRNQMLFDLGYPDSLSVVDLRRAIDDLDRRFHLVMISELMDESLVLLRHLLCWSPHDIVVFTKNARRKEVKPDISPKLLHTLRELNSADVLLYDHFLARHRESVHKFGEQRMADEVAALRSLRDEYYEDCGAIKVKGKDDALKFKEYSGLVSGYVTDNNTDANCQMLSMPELPLVDTVRKHQLKILGLNL